MFKIPLLKLFLSRVLQAFKKEEWENPTDNEFIKIFYPLPFRES